MAHKSIMRFDCLHLGRSCCKRFRQLKRIILLWAQGSKCFFLAYFLRYLFSAGTGYRKSTEFYKQDLPRFTQLKCIIFCGLKAPDVFSLLIFFLTSFRPQQAIEKATAFYQQNLPRFRQLKCIIFCGLKAPDVFFSYFLHNVFSAATGKSNGILQTRPAKI